MTEDSGSATSILLQVPTTESADEEEGLLYLYFGHINQFSYDKAKELAEKEKEASRSCQSSWQTLLLCLVQFAVAEKLYMSLMFLQSKGFLRKENTLKSNLESVRVDLRKVEEPGRSGTVNGIFAHLAGQLGQFITARMQQIDFYEKMCLMGTGKQMSFEELLPQITDIYQGNMMNFHHPILAPLKAAFSLECEILVQLLKAQLEMQYWRFLQSLMYLHEAHNKLGSCGAQLQNRESRKLGFSSSFLKTNQVPALYQWLWRLKGALVSKFSLYFYDILSKQTTSQEMKNVCAKQATDYYHKILSFQRKTDALAVALVFDANGVEDYKDHGYHHPKKYCEAPKGMDSYPAVVSYPSKPVGHWPNVVMIITDRASELAAMDRVVYFYDTRVQSTYFLSRIDPRMTLVVIFESKKSEKDSYITNFVFDLSLQLRCNKVFANLKPGSK